VGTTGVKLPRFIEPTPPSITPALIPAATLFHREQCHQRRLIPLYAGSAADCLRLGSVGEIAGIANSSYNASNPACVNRFGHGLSFLASYTYSKSVDDVSSFNITAQPRSPSQARTIWHRIPSSTRRSAGRSPLFDDRHAWALGVINGAVSPI